MSTVLLTPHESHSSTTVEAASGAEQAEHGTRDARERLRAMTLDNFQLIWRSLRRFGVGAEAVDDATQQVFEIAARKLEHIMIGSERPFLLQTAFRVAHGVRRSHARSREVHDEKALSSEHDPRPGPEELADLQQRRRRLDEILDAMPLELRCVFVLFELEGMSSVEIASALGIPVGTAASRLRRAREEFRDRAKRAQASSRGGAP